MIISYYTLGGLPIESYAVEYKEAQMSWPDARRRVWPLQQSGVYILEALQPMTTYDFRFGAKNLVGFSEWGAAQQFTMPRRGPPEAPAISRYPHYKLRKHIIQIIHMLL